MAHRSLSLWGEGWGEGRSPSQGRCVEAFAGADAGTLRVDALLPSVLDQAFKGEL